MGESLPDQRADGAADLRAVNCQVLWREPASRRRGCTVIARELFQPALRTWRAACDGDGFKPADGHLVAVEQPELYVGDLRTFVGSLAGR
jgi:hypothetical protein